MPFVMTQPAALTAAGVVPAAADEGPALTAPSGHVMADRAATSNTTVWMMPETNEMLDPTGRRSRSNRHVTTASQRDYSKVATTNALTAG